MFQNRQRDQFLFGAVPAMGKAKNSGVRDQRGVMVPYHDDPIRNPSASFMPRGYMASGYDSGRKY